MLKTVAAFASGEGGTVLIGVTDDGQIAGVDATKLDELTLALHNMIRSNIDPDPAVTVRPVPVDGKTVLLVEVTAGSAVSGACAGGRISASYRPAHVIASALGRSRTAPTSIGSGGCLAGVVPSKFIRAV